MDGVLLIDKPLGPTSHDIVARIRRAIGQREVGHTGTLDPRASGLLPLVLGRATKIASYLTGSDKTYEATISLGFATDTDDTEGRPLGEPVAALPEDDAIVAALSQFRGTFEQLPPNHSAKKVQGARAYALARRDEPVALKSVSVTVRALDWLGRSDDLVRVRVTASAGFYVRALARDLGARLNCGAHLAALRRTASGAFSIDDALGMDEAERLGRDVSARVIPAAEALRHLPAVRLTEAGARRAAHGNSLNPEHVTGSVAPAAAGAPVRILGADGRLVALAQLRGGILHPVVVLG